MESIAQRENTNTRVGLLLSGSDVASLLLRVMIGVVFIAHGAQKLFGVFGGGGLDAAALAMAGLGLRPGLFFAVLSGLMELGGGLLLLLGLLTPLAGLIIIVEMIVAIAVASGQKGFIPLSGRGYEYNLVLITIALALVITGPGWLSLDRQFGLQEAVAHRVRQMRTKYHR